MKSGKNWFLRLLDRVLSGGVWQQIGLLTAFIGGILLIFIVIAWLGGNELFGKEGCEESQGLWGVYYHFVDSGNQYMVNGYKKWFTLLISLAGSVLMGGVLISTISNIIERRVEDYQKGRVRYKKISDHYLIIGYGEITLSLIKRLLSAENIPVGVLQEEEAPNMERLVVVLTKQNVEEIRISIHAMLSEQEEKRVIFYSGDIESLETLRTLNAERAKMIFIQGEQREYGRDSKNIECVKNLSAIISANENIPAEMQIPVFVQFDRIPSFSFVQKLTLPEKYRMHIYFLPFNFHENWARLLWSYYRHPEEGYRPLDYSVITSGSDSFVHLFVVGFNRMGRALTLEALRLCHYANYADRGVKTKITIIDKDMTELWDFFCTQYPSLHQIEDVEIEVVEARVEMESVRARFVKAARDKNCLQTVAICLKDPDLSLATGLNLPEEVYAAGSSVLVRQELQCGLASIINEVDKGKFRNVKAFGMLSCGLDLAMARDMMATYVHAMWAKDDDGESLFGEEWVKILHTKTNEDIRQFQEKAVELWGTLSEERRWANRYSIDTFDMYLRSIGKKLVRRKTTQEINSGVLKDEDVKVLAPMEHCRWVAERTLSGWRQAKPGEGRDDDNLVHTALIPYNTLPSAEQKKDQNSVRNMAIFLALEGLEIVDAE